ncbi:MAG: translation initiation factor IF-2 [Desulfitobacteriia bacterium]
MTIRVHELAKELNIPSKELIQQLNNIGVGVKNHLSVVTEEDAAKVKQKYLSNTGQVKDKGSEKVESISPGSGEKQIEQEVRKKPSEEAGRPPENKKLPDEGQKLIPRRPPGQRPPGEMRPPGQRPPGEMRPPSQRPPGEMRPPGQRPPGEMRPPGQRPPGEMRRPQGQRPSREMPPAGSRPVGEMKRPPGQRPPGEMRPLGQRPPGEMRPPGQRPPGEMRRPQGQRPPGEMRPAGSRPAGEIKRPPGEMRPPEQRSLGDPRRPLDGRPSTESGRPRGQRMDDGFRPRPQSPRSEALRKPTGARQPIGGDRPFQPRPQGDFRTPGGQRPGDDGRRPPGTGRPFNEGSRKPAPGGRPGPDNKKGPQTQRIKIEGKSVELTVAEQPVKRQAPDKKKAHDNKDYLYEKKRTVEKDLTSILRKNEKSSVKDQKKEVAPKHIVIPESLTIQELALRMSRKASEVIKELMKLGVMATINQEIDADTAAIVAGEMGITVEVKVEKSLAVIEEIEDKQEDLKPRAPVVTVMGHVDHGKTSLLDAIRSTNVIASEAGGITQHIGAYQVEIKNQKITFLDTPGHEAFTAMRARGAQVTDVAVLVVAADDGVMPQTIEAINHAKAADVPIIVAINKIDKEEANSDRVKQELTEYGLVVEEWGGDTIAVPVSAKTRTNIENLLEMILLVAEMKELKANPNRKATGTVIEAKLDKGKGPVATVLVSKGTLNIGDIIVAGQVFGRIRAMVDDKGRRVKKAGPSMPVEVQGLSEVPLAGEIFNVVEDEKQARSITDARINEKKAEEVKQKSKISLDDLFDKIKEGEVKELNIIIKADVQGSTEAIKQSLEKLSTSEVRVNIIHGGVGTISESDVMLAAASNAIIIGFNVRHDSNTKATAELQGVDIRLYRVIYDAIDDVKAALEGMLDPDFKEVVQGKAEVRQVFKVPKAGSVAGSYVIEGKINRSSKIRVIRDGKVISENEIESLKRFKDDVKEVTEGYECGIGLKNYHDIKEGDIFEAFTMEEVKREL